MNEQEFAMKATEDTLETKFSELALTDILAKPDKTLLQHSIEAGMLAEQLMRAGLAKPAIERIATLTIDKEKLISSICFLIAAHDVGKCHPAFQAKMSEQNEHLHNLLESLALLSSPSDARFPHESESMWSLLEYVSTKPWRASQVRRFKDFAAITAYHHQGKEHDWSKRPACENPAVWHALQRNLLDEIEKRWQFHPELLETEDGLCGLTYAILSLMCTSDWMVSSKKWDNTLRGVPCTLEQKSYTFLKENKFLHDAMQNHLKSLDFQTIFGYIPNDLQKEVIKLAANRFQLMILEGPCGIGKTEAGLIAAILAGVTLSGVYLAMPTKATVRGIIERVRQSLAHAGVQDTIPEFDSSAVLSDDDRDRIDPELFSSAARLHMLYLWGVGTIDQSLKTIGMYKYACLGLVGLMDKVYIVDEVHAYDAFMLYQLERKIQECRFLGVPVVLQTATLPTKTKERLLKAAGIAKPQCEVGYPLITVCKDGKMTQVATTAPSKQYKIRTTKVKDVLKAMETKASNITSGCALFIVDTPANAIKLYKKLLKNTPANELFLYHSRDTVDAKTNKADALVKAFGKDRSNRPQRAIVIATSIVEQSLDIDMDYLFTMPCPIDLLFQRMGRQCRHVWPATTPETVIFVPEDLSTIRIYKTPLLELTIDAIGDESDFNTITDIRNLIDTVYYAYDSKNEDNMKRMRASCCIIDNPMCDTPNNVDSDGIAYERMKQQDAITRFAEYPTIQIAIVPPEMLTCLDFETERTILKQYTIAVPEYQVRHFTDFQRIEDGLLTDIQIYTTDNGVISECGHEMQITNLGLEIT